MGKHFPSIIIFIILFFAFTAIYPQDENPGTSSSTLSGHLKSRGTYLKGYGAVTTKFSSISKDDSLLSGNSDFSFFLGGKGGLTIQRFTIGASLSMLVNSVPYKCGDKDHYPCGSRYSDAVLSMNYGGAYFAYLIDVIDFFKIEPAFMVGHGYFRSMDSDFWEMRYGRKHRFFVMEPEINLVFVVTDYFALGIGAYFRIITAISGETKYTWKDVSTMGGSLDFRFGRF